MTEADWLANTDCVAQVEFVADRLSTRRQRLLALGFCRSVIHLYEHPDLIAALGLLEQYADGLIPEAEAQKARSQCRGLAQQVYERYRAWVDVGEPGVGSDPSPVEGASSEVAWAFAFAFNYNPVPVVEICTRVISARVTGALGFKMRENQEERRAEVIANHALVLRPIVLDVVGNPFRPVRFTPAWHTDTVTALARQMYGSGDFSAMPILADALQDAGCDDEDILTHCRSAGPHIRGCWVVDLLLGNE